MKKLNNILSTNKVTAYGFPAIKALETHSNPDGEPVIISSLSAAVMADMGIDTYYAPVMPRDSKFATAEDVIAADLDAQMVQVTHVDDVPYDAPVIIVSRHPDTVTILQGIYPNNTVISSVAPDNIQGKDVVGVLPPHLIQYAASFRAAATKDYDACKDGDLSGEELQQRMVFTSTVRVSVQ